MYSMVNYQNTYYSVRYGTTDVKICHDTEHQKLVEQRISSKCFLFNTFTDISDFLTAEVSK